MIRSLACTWFLSLAVAVATAAAPQDMTFPGRGWKVAAPESQGVDSAKLTAAVAYMDHNFGPGGAKELVIVRNGCLIHQGPEADACHNVWSCTKTFTSTVLGLLVADGKCALDDMAVKYLPELDDQYRVYGRIRLRHLASMSSGYKGQVVDVTPEQPWGRPIAYLTPTAPMYEPGAQVQYQDHQVFILGRILTRLAGEPEQSLLKRRVAQPIGMARFDWGVSGEADKIPLNNAAGTPTTPGVQTTACDMARFGLLYLNRGNWNGRQILPASFVNEATRNQVPGIGASSFLHGRYGFYWWTNDVKPDGKRPWPSAPPKTYTSHGHSANFCCVVPEWNMVIVRMGTTPIPSGILGVESKWDAFFARLAQAMDGSPNRGPAKQQESTQRVPRGTADLRSDRPSEMTFPGRNWEDAAPESQGIDSTKLQAAVAYLEKHTFRDGVKELVIVRNGRIVWKGSAIDNVHYVASMTKSFTSTVLGLLVDDGKCSLDAPAKDYVPELAASYPAVTLRHFATMTSGYRAIGDDKPIGNYRHGPSRTPLVPAPNPLFCPGTKFAYRDSAMNEFGYVLTRIAGQSLADLFQQRIAGPIGMDHAKWNWQELAKIDGLTINGGAGNQGVMLISAREAARFGHLFLNRGNWNGKQLLSAHWVDEATKSQVPASLSAGPPESTSRGQGVYGYNWWVNGLNSDGQRKWPGAPPRTFAAVGASNNRLFVVPEWSLVVARLAREWKEDERVGDGVWSEFLRMVGQAIVAPRAGEPSANGGGQEPNRGDPQ